MFFSRERCIPFVGCAFVVVVFVGCLPASSESDTDSFTDMDSGTDINDDSDWDSEEDTSVDSDTGQDSVSLSTRFRQVSGGALLHSANYKLQVSVGGSPMGEGESENYHAIVGSGAIANQ